MTEQMHGKKKKTNKKEKKKQQTIYEDVENYMNTALCLFSFIAPLTRRVPGFGLVWRFQILKTVTSS